MGNLKLNYPLSVDKNYADFFINYIKFYRKNYLSQIHFFI